MTNPTHLLMLFLVIFPALLAAILIPFAFTGDTADFKLTAVVTLFILLFFTTFVEFEVKFL